MVKPLHCDDKCQSEQRTFDFSCNNDIMRICIEVYPVLLPFENGLTCE